MRTVTEHHFASIDGQQIFYRKWSSIKPKNKVIVLLHRGHEHSGRMAHVVDELQDENASFYAWDARGCGRTEGTRGYAPSFMTWVYDLDAFIAHICAEHQEHISDIIVIGQSIGGVIASTWVHDFAPKIKGLILAAPAFSVNLIVPFALQGIQLLQKIKGEFFVKSYVKGKQLTHDPKRIESYATDPLITLPIASNVLIDLYPTSDRVIADAGAIVTPTMVLVSGKDAVVRPKQQHQFFENLSSPLKEIHTLEDFFHDTLGELEREKAFSLIRQFIAKLDANRASINLMDADKKGYTYNEYQSLLQEKSSNALNELNFSITRWLLKNIGQHAAQGIKIGVETGFDSGSSLDYVYINKAQGIGAWNAIGIGKSIDRGYLNSIGWRGIRIRKQNLGKLIQKYIKNLRSGGELVRIMDIAGGHGRYILDAIEPIKSDVDSILIRDYSDINIHAGNVEIQKRKLTDIVQFKNADAFDYKSLASETPKPTWAISSGVYELFADNDKLQASISGIYEALEHQGYFIYTNQPWHPQVELIARTLNNHKSEDRWIMRRRTQAEMDTLVEHAGFEKIEQIQDDWGIFTVSVARKK